VATGSIPAGKLKALAVADEVRSESLPAVPTTTESGFVTLQATFWAGIVAPIGTPAHVIDKLNMAINEFLRSPEVEARLAKFNAKPKIGSPQDFAKFWRDVMRSTTICATVVSLVIATAVASAQAPPPSAAAPAASPGDKEAISKACSDQANAKGLHGKARKKFRSECKKRGGTAQ
jgi:hypothetical protein